MPDEVPDLASVGHFPFDLEDGDGYGLVHGLGYLGVAGGITVLVLGETGPPARNGDPDLRDAPADLVQLGGAESGERGLGGEGETGAAVTKL